MIETSDAAMNRGGSAAGIGAFRARAFVRVRVRVCTASHARRRVPRVAARN